MPPRPTHYEGFREKLFLWAIGLIGIGVTAIISMLWALSVDMKVMQSKETERSKAVEETLKMSTDNNKILTTKADERRNDSAHNVLVNKINTIEFKIDIITDRKFNYGTKHSYSESIDSLPLSPNM